MNTAPIGLRDRKRAETRLRIETAAVEISTAEGLDGATVDMISEGAGISPRTFFNYFDSKEDAILGTFELSEVERAIATGIRSTTTNDLVAAIVSTMFDIVGPVASRAQLKTQRMLLVHEHPRLLSRQFAQFTQLNSTLSSAVTDFLAQRESTLPRNADHLAEIAVAACAASVRISVKEWVASGATDPLDSLRDHAIELTRETLAALK